MKNLFDENFFSRAIWLNLAGLWCILSLTLAIGMLIFAKYQTCDPILNKEIKMGEQVNILFCIILF